MDDQQIEKAISTYRNSISERGPVLDRIIKCYWDAAFKRRRVEEKRLWSRWLHELGIRKHRSTNSKYWSNDWPIYAFGVLASRAEVLERTWKAKRGEGLVSPKLSLFIVEVLRDCELVVRYFEAELDAVERNGSAHKSEGSRLRTKLNRVFPRQREILTYYEHHVLQLGTARLQDLELGSTVGRLRRRRAARDAEDVRRKWREASDITQLYPSITSTDEEKHDGGSDRLGDRPWLRAFKWLQSYTWELTAKSRQLVEALCAACENGDSKQAAHLLSRGAFIDGINSAKATPLECAIRQQHVDIVRLLVQKGANVNKGSALLAAVRSKNLQAVQLLVEAGADINKKWFDDNEEYGITSLHRACDMNLSEMVYFLVSQGADCTLRYCDHVAGLHNISPMHVARGQCGSLIQSIRCAQDEYSSAYRAMTDSRGRLPLFWALERRDWDAVGACDVSWPYTKDAVDNHGRCALHLFCDALSEMLLAPQMRHIVYQVVRIDKHRIRTPDKRGVTPLQMLASLCAMAPREPDDEAVFEHCKTVILDADREYQSRTTFPDDYYDFDHGMVYCFGTRPQLTDEESKARERQYFSRVENERKVALEQGELFDSMVAEAREERAKSGHDVNWHEGA